VAERGGVVVAELGDGEDVRGEREAEVGVGELGAQALAGGEHDRLVVERAPTRRISLGGAAWEAEQGVPTS